MPGHSFSDSESSSSESSSAESPSGESGCIDLQLIQVSVSSAGSKVLGSQHFPRFCWPKGYVAGSVNYLSVKY